MATLTTTKNYDDTTTLFASDLDDFVDDFEEFFNTTKLNDDNIQDDGLTGSTVLKDSSITAGKINASAITTAKIADGVVGSAAVATDNAVVAKIANATISTANLATTTIATAKIADGTIQRSKLSTAVNEVSSASVGEAITSTSATDVTNLTCTLAANGRPVEIRLIPDSASNTSYIYMRGSHTNHTTWTIKIIRDATTVWTMTCNSNYKANGDSRSSRTYYPVSSVYHIDTPTEGTYTYKIQAYVSDASTENEIRIYAAKLFVRNM